MEIDSIMIGFLLFFFAEFMKIVIAKSWPDHIKVKIDFDKEDTEDNEGSKNESRKAKHMNRQKMHAYWKMSAHDLKKLAEMQGLPREIKLRDDLMEMFVELDR